MQCERARELLGAYGDGELPAKERQEVGDHLASCRACRDASDDFRRLGRAVAAEGREPMPPGLPAKIGRLLDSVDAEGMRGAAPVPIAVIPRSKAGPFGQSWMSRAAALVLVAGLSSAGGWWLAETTAKSDRLQRELMDAHVRSLLQESPVQIATSDQHVVRPWFQGRTDVAPPAKDLKDQGFPLVGGRLDYVDGHRASVLVYRQRLHTINVFMWAAAPGSPDTAPTASSLNGYNMLSYRRGGVVTWMVSDVNADELRQLASLL
ncbi:MAG: anti-sigma factor [Proteobacteria bacterium]|nr:anti-sigma factor [Pseudomonadota bacterium]